MLQDAHTLREINNEQRVELEAKEIEIAHRIRDIQDVRIELSDLRNSNSWQMILKLPRRFRERNVPKKSNRERWMYRLLRVWRAWRRDGLVAVFRRDHL